MEQSDSNVSPQPIEVDYKEKYNRLVIDYARESLESHKYGVKLCICIGELEQEVIRLKGIIHESL